MIQHRRSTSPSAAADEQDSSAGSLTVWGLTPRQLHDAFWRSRGVQCVRRGEAQTLQRAAELYLLLEPDQLVVFNIAELSERLTWHNAAVTRLRLLDENAQPYCERVVVDRQGLVQRIERQYRPRMHGTTRVVLTSRRRLAGNWINAPTRRQGWDALRRSVPWSHVDHWKAAGITCTEGDLSEERELIDAMVRRWPTPGQAIGGIEETEPGIWRRKGEPEEEGVIRVGPLWLGRGDVYGNRKCLIGPLWLADQVGDEEESGDHRPAELRPISQIELAEAARSASEHVPDFTYAMVKRSLDVLLSAAALVVLMPVMLIIALAIKLEDGGPIFFGHRRQGSAGQPFTCWKFRTMHTSANRIARDLDAYNVSDGRHVFIPDDPRVTRVGRWLRRSHLDETPQFFNVLVGQMSLVGPRPSPDEENQYCPAWRDSRLSVRPGITGLWQLKRTREPGEDFQEWIKYDIEYVERASIWLDARILIKTAWLMLRGRSDRASE